MTPDPQMFVELTTVRSPLEVEAVVAALKERGIEAIGFNHASSTLQTSWAQQSISVHREDFERATAALKDIRAESAEIDWDNVDVGEMPAEVKRELERKSLPFKGRTKTIGLFLSLGPVLFGVILAVVAVVIGIIELIGRS